MTPAETNLDLDTLAKQLWAIGDPVRLEILRSLPTEPTCEKACNVSKIAKRIGLSQPATSHHLRILRQAGIITNRKTCRDMIYWIDLEASGLVCHSLRDLLSKGGCE
jgi:ArsR family transcriptional regulator